MEPSGSAWGRQAWLGSLPSQGRWAEVTNGETEARLVQGAAGAESRAGRLGSRGPSGASAVVWAGCGEREPKNRRSCWPRLCNGALCPAPRGSLVGLAAKPGCARPDPGTGPRKCRDPKGGGLPGLPPLFVLFLCCPRAPGAAGGCWGVPWRFGDTGAAVRGWAGWVSPRWHPEHVTAGGMGSPGGCGDPSPRALQQRSSPITQMGKVRHGHGTRDPPCARALGCRCPNVGCPVSPAARGAVTGSAGGAGSAGSCPRCLAGKAAGWGVPAGWRDTEPRGTPNPG